MLYIVLLLVLAAFGLLITALTTAHTLWAWLSVLVSVVAAGLLIYDWLRSRRAVQSAPTTRSDEDGDEFEDDLDPLDDPLDEVDHEQRRPEIVEPSAAQHEPPAAQPVVASTPDDGWAWPEQHDADVRPEPAPPPVSQPQPEPEPVAIDEPEPLPDEEPGEEDTDAADLLIIGGLSAEVKVVDEHPRYHLARCAWLAGRSTIPIAVSEARQLGFTPCVLCGPDAVLAARHRAGRGARQRKADV